MEATTHSIPTPALSTDAGIPSPLRRTITVGQPITVPIIPPQSCSQKKIASTYRNFLCNMKIGPFVMISLLQSGGRKLLCTGFIQKTQRTTFKRYRTAMTLTSLPTDGCPLSFQIGPYSAAEISVPVDDKKLLSKLQKSIEFWKENGYTSAWITIPAKRASLIEQLSSSNNREGDNFGFDLHHINSEQQTIVMKKWLVDGIEDKIPPWASHQVGVAGFVLNDNNEILLIREWSGPLSNRAPSKQWKMPGGMLDRGESFEKAVIRETLEETGIECDFESILSFWHRHELKWGQSDLYYVCMLRPKQLGLDNICPVEISAATWMHIDEFLAKENHPLITKVLKTNFRLDGMNNVGLTAERLKPVAEMLPNSVQWPGREPYPTYFSVPSK